MGENAIAKWLETKWLETIQEVALQNPKLDDAMRDRINLDIADLRAVAKYLEE